MNRRTTLIAATMALLSLASPAAAVEPTELSDVRNAYRQSQLEIAEQNQELLLAELRLLNGPYDNVRQELDWAVERWRPVVDMYFPEDRVDWALRIMACESHGDPQAKNPNSSASGLFQHLARLWPERAVAAGWADADVFDPFDNIAVAAWLLDNGGTSHWVCKAHR
ncbi:MAG: transglycosylase SLT domain-containing protein [Acidimicrobiia bacterium]|nr:transglycosylase SLT domain-containing protein [Acidimicrobiia bacterium]MDX2466376.1 transglycosylase SLT domain-containing protein [Acidimicrobiia bacterium]